LKSIDEFLALLKNVLPSGPNKWKACCPGHHDGEHKGDQSLSVEIASDKILLHCFAGCKTADVVKSLDLKMSDLFIGEKKKAKPIPRQAAGKTKKKIKAIYKYYSAGNVLLFEVVRYEPKEFRQRRPDGNNDYIYNLDGVEWVIYRLPQVLAGIIAGDTIYHCEGEKDADNLAALGFNATTSPMGAGNWKAAYAQYYQGAKQVIIIPDKDSPGRAYAREVAMDIYPIVQAVKILELPSDNVKDASDWIEAGGTAAQLSELAEDAKAYTPPADVSGQIDYQVVGKLLKNESDGNYVIIEGKPHKVIHLRDGETVNMPLANFVARITEDLIKDDGAAQSRFLRIQGRLNGSSLPTIIIPENQFDGMTWPRKHWGVKAQVEKSIDKVERHMSAVITKSSGKVKERMIYTHTGWREIDGKQVFLSAGGAIGTGDVEVELPPPLLHKIRLPQPEGNAAEAINKSFELMDIADIELTLPTFIWPYLSVLNVFEDMNVIIWYQGKTGQFKSVLSALAMSHFGDFTHKDFKLNWETTKTRLEQSSYIAKDIPFVIDDYAPASDRNMNREMKNTVAYIIQGYANRQGKGRSNPDMTSQFTYYPRGLLVSSGEHLPPVTQSRQARIFPIPISLDNFFQDGKGNYELLTQAQKDRRYYPVAMAHYIAWIQQNWAAVNKSLHEYHDKYHAAVPKKGVHLRLPETVALMQAGYNIVLDFAADHGVIPASGIADHLDLSNDIFMRLLKRQSGRVNAESPGIRFIDVLQGLLASGRAILRRRSDTGNWTPAEAAPGQAIIGWDDPAAGIIFLNPRESYAQVYRQCDSMQEYFGHPQAAVWDDFNELKYLAGTGNEETRTMLKPRRFGSSPIPVVWLKRSVIYGEEEANDEF
jgi:hypothetical protein